KRRMPVADAGFAEPKAFADRQTPALVDAREDGELAMFVEPCQPGVARVGNVDHLAVDIASGPQVIAQPPSRPAARAGQNEDGRCIAHLAVEALPQPHQCEMVLADLER